jgi:hypothetical protein
MHVVHGWTTRGVRRDANMPLRHRPRCTLESRQVGDASAAHDSSPQPTLVIYEAIIYRTIYITYFPRTIRESVKTAPQIPTRRALAGLAVVSVLSAIEKQQKRKAQKKEPEFAVDDMSGELQTIPARHGVATFVGDQCTKCM